MIKNAAGKSPAIEKAAFQRLIALSTDLPRGTLEYDCWAMVHTIEELRRAQGRTWRMNRLRPTIADKGEAQALVNCVTRETDGFQEILDFGMPELTAEAIVLRHPDRFEEQVRAIAQTRLASAGVALP